MLCLTVIFLLPNMFFREVVMNISCVFSWDLTFPSERGRVLPIFCGNLTNLPSEKPSKKQVVQNLIQLGNCHYLFTYLIVVESWVFTHQTSLFLPKYFCCCQLSLSKQTLTLRFPLQQIFSLCNMIC